jgi:hypothetical protein
MLPFEVGSWGIWVPLGAGAVVTALVIGFAVIYERWRHRTGAVSPDDDVPIAELLRMLEDYNRNRATFGLPPEQLTEEVKGKLLAGRSALPDALPVELAEDQLFLALGGDDRRASQRRWGNPTEVHLRSDLWYDRLHGLVVNRSAGGLGIYADMEIPPGTYLEVRVVEAPANVPKVRVEVRHCRRVGNGYFIGCQFSEDVPWEARAWLG